MAKQYTAFGWIALGIVVSATGCGSDDAATSASNVDGTTPRPPSTDGPSNDGDENGGAPNGADAPAGGGPAAPPPEPIHPGCAKEAYTEALPTTSSLAGVPFSKETATQFLLGALEKRYPIGKAIVEGGASSPRSEAMGSCADIFLPNKSSAEQVLRQAPTVVHECGHFYDLGKATGDEATYVLRPDLVFTCKAGDTTSRGGATFARSLITRDSHANKRNDRYAQTYLTGQSGQQGYNSVLEEATQYVNSLATALAFREQYAGTRASERDGILTFLWYVERYLALARTEHPDAYARISGDACWRQATLSIWDRGWFYLRATKDVEGLGLNDAAIEPLVNEPALLAEIDALRKLECE
jgi:hypothetical protein